MRLPGIAAIAFLVVVIATPALAQSSHQTARDAPLTKGAAGALISALTAGSTDPGKLLVSALAGGIRTDTGNLLKGQGASGVAANAFISGLLTGTFQLIYNLAAGTNPAGATIAGMIYAGRAVAAGVVDSAVPNTDSAALLAGKATLQGSLLGVIAAHAVAIGELIEAGLVAPVTIPLAFVAGAAWVLVNKLIDTPSTPITVTKSSDGTVTMSHPNVGTMTIEPDGTVTNSPIGGSSVTVYPNGDTTSVDRDGNTTRSSRGIITRTDPDGNTTLIGTTDSPSNNGTGGGTPYYPRIPLPPVISQLGIDPGAFGQSGGELGQTGSQASGNPGSQITNSTTACGVAAQVVVLGRVWVDIARQRVESDKRALEEARANFQKALYRAQATSGGSTPTAKADLQVYRDVISAIESSSNDLRRHVEYLQDLEWQLAAARLAAYKICNEKPSTQAQAQAQAQGTTTTPSSTSNNSAPSQTSQQCRLQSYVTLWHQGDSGHSDYPSAIPGSSCPTGSVFEVCTWRADPAAQSGQALPNNSGQLINANLTKTFGAAGIVRRAVDCTPVKYINRACWTQDWCTAANPTDCPKNPLCSCTQSAGAVPSTATLLGLAPSVGDGGLPFRGSPCKAGDIGCVCAGAPQQIVSSAKLGDPLPPITSNSGTAFGGSSGGTGSSGGSGGTASGGSTSVAPAGGPTFAPAGPAAPVPPPIPPSSRSQSAEPQNPSPMPIPPAGSTPSPKEPQQQTIKDWWPLRPSTAKPPITGETSTGCVQAGGQTICTTQTCVTNGAQRNCTESKCTTADPKGCTPPGPGQPSIALAEPVAPQRQPLPPSPTAPVHQALPAAPVHQALPVSPVAPPPPQSSPGPSASVQPCVVKNITVPWGGNGAASMTVLRGNSCFIGWNDTGNAILDAMEVNSSPAHGSLKQRDAHSVTFNPNPGFHGQDSFSLLLHEHSALDGRKATATVKVSVTIE
jgi:hypothetical protein